MQKYKAIVFDLDGTLINTLEDLMDSVNFALEKYGFPKRSLEEIRTFVGNGMRRLVNLSVPNGTAEDISDACFEAFKAHYKTNCMNKTKPYDGIGELIEKIKALGIKTAVVTNKRQDSAQVIIRSFFGENIETVIGQIDGVAQKPEPDGVWLALEKLGVERKNAVYIGDSEVDCLTAKNSGLPIIGVTWGFRERKTLEENGADFIVDMPEEILNMI